MDSKSLETTAAQFWKGQHIRSYQTLFTALNKFGQDQGNQISHDNYAAGYTLFAFDLTPDLENDWHVDEQKSGPMRVEIHFAEPLPHTIIIIIWAEFENTIENIWLIRD